MGLLYPLSQKGCQAFEPGKILLDFRHFQAVFLGEAHQDIVVGLRQVIHDAVDVGLDVLGAADVLALVRGNVQRVGDAEVVPQKFVQGGVLVDPDNGGDGHNSHAEIAGLDEKVLRDEHILCRQLGQSLQFLLRLFQKSPWTSVDPQTQAGRRQYRKQDK